MYVILQDSYNFCASCIVRDTENHNFLLASCCNVDVVKGADGVLFHGFFSISSTVNFAVLQYSKKGITSLVFLNSIFKVAGNVFLEFHEKVHMVLNVEELLNFSISLSLSTIIRTATDCTLHAEIHHITFFHSTGESSNHTK
jgi:hypothetical protein